MLDRKKLKSQSPGVFYGDIEELTFLIIINNTKTIMVKLNVFSISLNF